MKNKFAKSSRKSIAELIWSQKRSVFKFLKSITSPGWLVLLAHNCHPAPLANCVSTTGTQVNHLVTPIPNYPCEILHIDVFTLEKKIYLSCIDKFSQFAKLFPLQSKSAIHLRETLLDGLSDFKQETHEDIRGLIEHKQTLTNFLWTRWHSVCRQ